MPQLTDLTAHDLILTYQVGTRLSRLPLLRRLHGVLWPLLQVGLWTPHGAHFPSLVSFGVRSQYLFARHPELAEAAVPRPCGRMSQTLFPHAGLLLFLRSLPKKLRGLRLDLLHEEGELNLSTFKAHRVRQELEEQRLDAEYAHHQANRPRGTSQVKFAPASTRTSSCRVPQCDFARRRSGGRRSP
jgi:hypothetical protein